MVSSQLIAVGTALLSSSVMAAYVPMHTSITTTVVAPAATDIPTTYIVEKEFNVRTPVTAAEHSALVAARQPLSSGFIDLTHLLTPNMDVDGMRSMHRFDNADRQSPMSSIPLTQSARVLRTLTTAVHRDRVQLHQIQIASSAPNRYTYSPEGIAAATQLRDMLVKAGNGSSLAHTVSMVGASGDTTAQQSVVLSIPGSSRSSEVVIVAAHLDTRDPSAATEADNTNGAADIAATAEACLAILESGEQPLRTVECHFYAGHYVGLTGSAIVAERYSDATDKTVVGVYNLDSVARKDMAADTDGNSVYLINSWPDMTDSVATSFVGSVMHAYTTLIPMQVGCGYACSDHTTWGRLGFPVAATTNTFKAQPATVEIDMDIVFEHVKAATAFAVELAYRPE